MTRAPRRIVVVGGGIAALTTCDELRSAGFDGELTLVGEESHAPYNRPALSKALILNPDDITSHRLPDSIHGAEQRLGVRAVGLDADRGVVELDDGTQLPYDRLVIATGSRARRLGGEESGELVLRNLDDALKLRSALTGAPSVTVIGGGPLGMEIASGAVAAGCAVTLVSDVAPLAPHLGPYLSEVFTSAAREHGVRVIVTGSARITHVGGATAVALPDGELIASDVVVTTAGDIPNVEWLSDTGLLTDGRLRVDSRGRLNERIVAAGDVAEIPTRQGPRRVPLWTSAIDQAKVAARVLLRGDDAPELNLQPYFWTEQFGLSLKACGPSPMHGEPEFLEGDDARGPALLHWHAQDGDGTAVAINFRIPVPRLRRLAAAVTA